MPPTRPRTVPAEAVYNVAEEQWELGARNAKGKPEGPWKYWWSTTGHHCCDTVVTKNGTVETYTRYHPDGTWSRKGVLVNGIEEGPVCFQKSKGKTTELVLTEKLYAKVFSVTCVCKKGEASSWKYFSAKGVRVDLDGEPLMTDEQLAKSFGGREAPPELRGLLELQRLWGMESFTQGFAVQEDDKSLIATWSRDKGFLDALMPFASANGTGSCYALWNDGTSSDLAKMPVVVFGDEGGCFVIAENVRGLLEVLSADIEPSVWPDSVDFDGENVERSERIAEFKKWLKAEFQITPVKDPSRPVKRAQARLGKAFSTWVSTHTEPARTKAKPVRKSR